MRHTLPLACPLQGPHKCRRTSITHEHHSNGSGTPHHGALQNSPRRKPRRKAEQNTHDYSQQGRQPQQLRTHNRHTTAARPAPTLPASQLGRQPQQSATRQKDNNTHLDSSTSTTPAARPTSTKPLPARLTTTHLDSNPPRLTSTTFDNTTATHRDSPCLTSAVPPHKAQRTSTVPVPLRLPRPTSTHLDSTT